MNFLVSSYLFCNCSVIIRNSYSKSLTQCRVVLFGKLRSILNRHLRDISFACQNLHCHLTGCYAQIVVADGKSCHAAACADAFLTGDNRNTGRLADIADNFCIGRYSIISRQIYDIAFICSSCSYGSQIVGIREGILLAGIAKLLQGCLYGVYLVLGVCLSGSSTEVLHSLHPGTAPAA